MKRDRHTHTQTHGHRDSMKESAKGRFFEKHLLKLDGHDYSHNNRNCFLVRLNFLEGEILPLKFFDVHLLAKGANGSNTYL